MRPVLVVLSFLGIFLQGCHSGITGQKITDEVVPRSMVADEACARSTESAVERWLQGGTRSVNSRQTSGKQNCNVSSKFRESAR